MKHTPWKHEGHHIYEMDENGEYKKYVGFSTDEGKTPLLAAAPELLNSAELDAMFPMRNEKERDEAWEFASSLGWKKDMPIEHFAYDYRKQAITKARG